MSPRRPSTSCPQGCDVSQWDSVGIFSGIPDYQQIFYQLKNVFILYSSKSYFICRFFPYICTNKIIFSNHYLYFFAAIFSGRTKTKTKENNHVSKKEIKKIFYENILGQNRTINEKLLLLGSCTSVPSKSLWLQVRPLP